MKSIGNVEVEMSKQTSAKNREKLSQLSKKELVEMILTQQEVIEYLKQEIEKLKVSRDLDSKISSKPPSSDLLKKSILRTNRTKYGNNCLWSSSDSFRLEVKR